MTEQEEMTNSNIQKNFLKRFTEKLTPLKNNQTN